MKIDTIHDSIVIAGKIVIKPIPTKVIIHDTILVPLKESWYDSTVSQSGAKFRWSAKANGELEYINFSDFVFPKEIIIKTKTVDTCFDKPPGYKAKNHFGISIGATANTIKDFPNIDADVWWSIKDKWAIYVGVEQNMYHKETYLKGGVRIFFK
jgi:hypothetical protein